MRIKSGIYLGAVFFAVAALASAQVSIIPQIADGGQWQTTLVLTNTTSSSAVASLIFYQETSGGATQLWNLSFQESVSPQSLSLAGGATLFLHTLGTASTTSVGWAQLQAGSGIVAYAIFTQRVAGRQDQDGTAPAAAAATRILMPFDNSTGFVTSMAVVNPTGSSETISVNIQLDTGAISQASLPALPALGHSAFTVTQQFAATNGHRGLLEFYVSSGSFSIIALRFNSTGAFTAAPVYAQTGSPIIGGSSSGGGGGTKFLTLQATVTYQPSGAASFTTIIIITPNADGVTYSASLLGGAALLNGTTSNQGQTFTFTQAQSGGVFLDQPAEIFLVVSSGSLTLTITQSIATTGYLQGNVTGTLSLTGTALGSGTPITLSGPIVGSYLEQLPLP